MILWTIRWEPELSIASSKQGLGGVMGPLRIVWDLLFHFPLIESSTSLALHLLGNCSRQGDFG